MVATEDGATILYHDIVEQAPDALILVDADGLVRIWNARAAEIFGYTAQEVLGGPLDVIIPESLRAAHWQGFRKAVDTGVTKYGGRVMTTRSMHKDGRKLYVDLSFSLLKDATGKVLGALAIARDVTESYQAARALKARVAELEAKLQESGKAS
ncbi:MAG: PAS domain S-box protein [Burkholderiales bacterium]|nr:PAS domain S-box protein [Burkholderiales bacterium]PZN02632.1 MAG: hypothetical protein DIU74_07410 [Pseudomonadota bacterium]